MITVQTHTLTAIMDVIRLCSLVGPTYESQSSKGEICIEVFGKWTPLRYSNFGTAVGYSLQVMVYHFLR